jgi:hypothetical protein
MSLGIITIEPCFIACYDVFMKFSMVSANSAKSEATKKQFSFCSSVSSHGTNLAETYLILGSSIKLA